MPVSNGQGLVTVMSNSDLERMEREELEKSGKLDSQNSPVVLGIASYIRTCWEAAKRAKEPHRQRMLSCLRQRNGEYEPEKLAAIRQEGGSEVYIMLTDEKCNAAESWIEDILSPANDKIWSISPTPIPEIPPTEQIAIVQKIQQTAQDATSQQVMMLKASGQPVDTSVVQKIHEQTLKKIVEQKRTEIMERAQSAADVIEKELDDSLTEAQWHNALLEVIEDIIGFPAGILKGPLVRREMDIVWGPDGQAQVGERLNTYYERVSPFDIYPAPSSEDINDGFLIERHVLTRSDLNAMKGTQGYDDDAIDKVLEEYGRGGLRSWLWSEDAERKRIQGQDDYNNDPEARIEALQFWGSVQGLMMLEFGMPIEDIEDVLGEYYVEAWLIGNYVIKAEINGDPLGRKPYFKASYRKRNGQFWGYCLPEIIKDIQEPCNAAIRNLLNNIALSSGPMVGLDIGAFADGEKVTKIKPWKIWQFDLKAYQGNKTPLWFFQPTPMVTELMAVYEKFSTEADNKSGIPKYAYGQQATGGAMNTASGLSMMMGNATKAVKKVIANIDRGIIQPSIKRMHEYLILNDPDYTGRYQGDINICSKGSSAMIAKEQQQVRRNEFMQIILSSEPALNILGQEGLAAVLREILKGLDIGLDDVVPTEEEMKAAQQAQQQQMMMEQQAAMEQGQQPGGPANGPAPKQIEASGAEKGGAEANTVGKRM